MNINLLIHIQYPTVQHLFCAAAIPDLLLLNICKNWNELFKWKQCTVTESSEFASAGSLSKHNVSLITVHQMGTLFKLYIERVLSGRLITRVCALTRFPYLQGRIWYAATDYANDLMLIYQHII